MGRVKDTVVYVVAQAVMDGVVPEIRVPIDLARYAGDWFEVARSRAIPFEPPGVSDVRAHYKWDGRTFSIRNEALIDNRVIEWSTVVTRIENEARTRFQVKTQGQSGVYRILMLDMDHYEWAVVGSDDVTNWVWVLCRQQLMPETRWLAILRHLEDYFNVDPCTLIYTPHTIKSDKATPLSIEERPQPIEAPVWDGPPLDPQSAKIYIRRRNGAHEAIEFAV